MLSWQLMIIVFRARCSWSIEAIYYIHATTTARIFSLVAGNYQ